MAVNHSMPLATINGTLQSVSTLLTALACRTGRRRPERRLVARLGAFGLERFEQRRFFARLVGAGAAMDVERPPIEPGTEDVPAELAGA